MKKKVNKGKKLSVIVAIYNTEKFLYKCLDSIVNQDYKDLEIILVNDASTDDSNRIIEEYKSKDNRIIVLENHSNLGLSASRNKGLDIATGEYIGFIDSDDYIPENYYKVLMDVIGNSDIAVCDFNVVSDTRSEVVKCGNRKNEREVFINNGLAASACNKIFKNSCFNGVRYPVGLINEDVAVILPLLANCKNIVYTDKTFYNYIQHSNSIQNSKVSMKRFDIFKTVEYCLEKIDSDNIKDIIIYNQLITLLLYVLPREKSFIYRYKLLKNYFVLSKVYNLSANKYYQEFLKIQGFKHRIFYKVYVSLVNSGFIMLANMLIVFYDLYKICATKNLIKLDVSKFDIENAARLNQKNKEIFKISVVVPNYNYARFLYQRLYSILYQNVRIHEIIILDDNSSDDSKKIIEELKGIISPYVSIKVIYNKKNSGSAFKQWAKGFSEATGDYVWIAEADDYCSKDLLYNLQKNMSEDTIISYSDTSFVDESGRIILKSIEKEIDIQNTGHFGKSFVSSGIDELENYAYLNCTIANVSSSIIKNGTYSFFEEASSYKQAGDWYIYVNLMSLGNIKYVHKQLNYYRIHGNNVTSVTKKTEHFEEIKKIHKYLNSKLNFNRVQKKRIKERYDFLIKQWDLE